MGLIQELDYFVQYCKTETKAKRMKKKDFERIIKAVDTLQNVMESLGY